jgi:hypothetical protein
VSDPLIIALRSSIWDKGEFAIQEIHGNLETLETSLEEINGPISPKRASGAE